VRARGRAGRPALQPLDVYVVRDLCVGMRVRSVIADRSSSVGTGRDRSHTVRMVAEGTSGERRLRYRARRCGRLGSAGFLDGVKLGLPGVKTDERASPTKRRPRTKTE
jgi:hypothetical protein